MASGKAIVAAIVIAIIIVIGSVAGLTLLGRSTIATTTSSMTSESSSSSPSSSSSSSPSIIQNASSSTRLSTTNTTTVLTSTTATTTSTPIPVTYSLKLSNPGTGAVLNSSMHTFMGQKYFPGDGPCCSIPPVDSDIVTYNDNGNVWTWQGDLNPGSAYASDNGSGFKITYSTAAGCPHHELMQDHESFDDCSFYGSLAGAPSNATVFSVEASIPYYDYYSSCRQDTGGGGSGCTYEITPYNEAAFGIDVGGNIVYVAFAEVCNSPCSTNGLLMTAYVSQGGSDVTQTLVRVSNTTYTPLHRLTIATDRRTYIDLYVDNERIYSNATLPTGFNGTGYALQLSERTSVNNEVSIVTWSNLLAYESGYISATGLPAGSTLVVASGANNFQLEQSAGSNGTAIIDVVPQMGTFAVSVQLNGKTLVSYNAPAEPGSQFTLVNSTGL